MNVHQAEENVLGFLQSLRSLRGKALMILQDYTIELDDGWIFFYQSRKFIEEFDIESALAGNAPIFVDRETGQMSFVGSSSNQPTDYRAQYRQFLRPTKPGNCGM